MARGLKFRILKVEALYYLCSKNKGADQLCGYCEADLRLCFAYAKSQFSHDEAHFIFPLIQDHEDLLFTMTIKFYKNHVP